MSDDWNLEMSNCEVCGQITGYTEEDIETLHKKIIEDLDEIYKYKWTHGYNKIREIIDRRFGIK